MKVLTVDLNNHVILQCYITVRQVCHVSRVGDVCQFTHSTSQQFDPLARFTIELHYNQHDEIFQTDTSNEDPVLYLEYFYQIKEKKCNNQC